jgi:uncharacterized phage protein (TIGR02220 family)
MQGWISVYRELLDKPIWTASTPEQKTILMTLMLMANHEPNEWEFKGEKFTVEKGQMITSLESITQKCGKGVTMQNVRTALKRFEKYGFLTSESTNKNRLITLVNWEVYQHSKDEPNKQTNKRLTSNQQATNKQLTTNNNVNNDNNEKNDKKEIPYAEIVDYLNLKAGTKYKHSGKKTKDLITARWNENFVLTDFQTVIDKKTAEWLNDPGMNKYLRPETLFGTKFESYLNQIGGTVSGQNTGSFGQTQRTSGRQYDIELPEFDYKQR